MENTPKANFVSVAFWAIVLIAPLPGLSVYLSWLSDLDQYGYIYPLFLALFALILFRWDYRLRMPADAFAISLVALGSFITLFAAYRASPWFSAIGFSLTVMAWLRTHFSSAEDHHRLTYLALLLLMTIRLPLNLDLQLAASLQRVTSSVSSYLLDSFSVPHYLRGNVIELPSGTLFVEEACSGVQSLFTVLFLVCLWIVFRRRPLIATPVYLIAGVMWAMVMNIFRITTIALAQEWYSWDLSTGVAHEVLGWICLGLAVVMMLSTDRLIRVAFFPIPPDESGHLGNPVSRIWNRLLIFGISDDSIDKAEAELEPEVEVQVASNAMVKGLLAGALLLGIPSFALGYRVVQTRFQTRIADSNRPLLWEPKSRLMSRTSYASQITDHQSLRGVNNKQLGNHADVWTVDLDGIPVRIAVCQPYPEWHDMRLCYSGSGWQVNAWNPTLEPLEQESEYRYEQWPVSYAEFVRDNGDFGTLLFCGLTRDMTLLAPPMRGFKSMFNNRVKDRGTMGANTIMLQLWVESDKPLIPEKIERIQRLFDSFREEVIEALSPDLPAANTAARPDSRKLAVGGGIAE